MTHGLTHSLIHRTLRAAIAGAILAVAGCQGAAPAAAPAPQSAAAAGQSIADLSGIQQYLAGKSAELAEAAAVLQEISSQYYALAQGQDFDYAALWQKQQAEVVGVIEDARAAWIVASPLYEQMEGIVAGTPALAHFDVDLDAGSAASEGPDGAVSFDITLPDGAVLAKPGNLFGVTESALWGTFDPYRAAIAADFDGDGTVGFGEALPDANVLKGSADLLAQMTSDLHASAEAWQPSAADAFTALVVMVPTMNEYFASWRDSRFVSGDGSTQRDFVAISRLADILGILGGLEVVYEQVRPLIETIDAGQAAQIAEGLVNLQQFVAGIHDEEQAGARFTPEEADTLGAEAQNRATALTGQLAQVAARLEIAIAGADAP